MRKKPLVSVILPVYNECRFLQKAINSVINQTYPNLEIIIVNDGSTNPEVEEICLGYINRIVYLKKENGGVAAALNCAIDVANGEYIARMDGDDIAYPERIYQQVRFLENNKDIDICGTNFANIDENDLIIAMSNLPLKDYEIKAQNMFQDCLCHPSIMFRKTVFDSGIRYDENVKAEDYELWLRIEKKVKFANLQECLLGYRNNKAGVTKVYSDEIYLSTIMLIKKHLNRIMDNAFENISEYSLGDIGVMIRHTKNILSFLQEQLNIYSIIIEWNENVKSYHSEYLTKIINGRWEGCIKNVGLRNFLINKNRSDFLKIQSFVHNQGNCGQFHKIASEIIHSQLETLRFRKRYLIYSIGKRGQAIYSEFLTLHKQERVKWDLIGFGDKQEEVKEFFSYPVYSINKIKDVEVDYIIIATNKYFEEIREELIDRGVEKNKILDTTWMQWIEMYMK